MSLLLVQHGVAKTEKEDPARSLSDDGVKATDKVARWLSAVETKVDEIRHSGKKRAEQTAAIFAKHLSPRKGVTQTAGLNPMDDVGIMADELKEYQGSLMLVGHLPFMSRFTGLLVAGNAEKEIIRFKNSGVVCLGEREGLWHVDWAVVPKLIRE